MRFIPHLLWLAGVGLLIYAGGSYAGHSLPYQDPTPELLAIQRDQLHTAKIVALVGIVFFVVGGLLALRRRGVSTSSR
jgi:hypothetical protein